MQKRLKIRPLEKSFFSIKDGKHHNTLKAGGRFIGRFISLSVVFLYSRMPGLERRYLELSFSARSSQTLKAPTSALAPEFPEMV